MTDECKRARDEAARGYCPTVEYEYARCWAEIMEIYRDAWDACYEWLKARDEQYYAVLEQKIKALEAEADEIYRLLVVSYTLAEDGIVIDVNSQHGEMISEALDRWRKFKAND